MDARESCAAAHTVRDLSEQVRLAYTLGLATARVLERAGLVEAWTILLDAINALPGDVLAASDPNAPIGTVVGPVGVVSLESACHAIFVIWAAADLATRLAPGDLDVQRARAAYLALLAPPRTPRLGRAIALAAGGAALAAGFGVVLGLAVRARIEHRHSEPKHLGAARPLGYRSCMAGVTPRRLRLFVVRAHCPDGEVVRYVPSVAAAVGLTERLIAKGCQIVSAGAYSKGFRGIRDPRRGSCG